MREIDRRLSSGETLLVAAPGLIEAYAVLTRLPPPHRLSPTDTRTLLVANFMSDPVQVVALEANGYAHLLQDAPERRIAGGTIYDAVILACALAAGADVLLTFNDRHFRQLAVEGVQIVIPT
jgi:predicted nucleic acid-binding protein